MTTRHASELLYDFEASLRLVDSAINEFGEEAAEVIDSPAAADLDGAPSVLPKSLLRAFGEITEILERLRESRGILEQAAVDRLQHMNEKLCEVSSATELAATDILDGLDRAVATVDQLDALGEGPDDRTRGITMRGQLRDELFGMMVHLQFQDITTQQLAYASSVIVDMEQRVAQIVSVFDPHAQRFGGRGAATPSVAAAPVTFDPNATNTNAANRQALADEIFRR